MKASEQLSYVLTAIFLLTGVVCLEAQLATAPEIGDGTADNPYQIATLENLYWIAASDDVVPEPDRGTRWASHYIQTANIDASETREWFGRTGWRPIGYYIDYNLNHPFRGNYNGQNHIIENLYINMPNTGNMGLFGLTNNSLIKNLGLINVDITGDDFVGGLVGNMRESSTVSNCYSTGIVTGRGLDAGGLIGLSIRYCSIDNSYSTARVTGERFVGGLLGHNAINSTVIDSYSTGNITGNIEVGGLLGHSCRWSSVIDSYSLGDVRGNNEVGGLVGRNMTYSNIHNSYSTGDVRGDIYVGGLVGFNRGDVPMRNDCNPRYDTGNSCDSSRVCRQRGDSTISSSYSTGNVTGNSRVGGLVGEHSHEATIKNSYSTGIVTGNAAVGGLVGIQRYDATTVNSYWNTETSEQAESAGGEGRTTDDMIYPYAADTYEIWDFDEIWREDIDHRANNGYPYLQWQIRIEPYIASNPLPEDNAANVSIELEYLSWGYIHNHFYSNPAGFRVYFSDTGEFGEEDDFVWVPYVEEQIEYSTSEILPEELEYKNSYYWQVVPTTKEEGTGEGHDAENVPVWAFTAELNPVPAAAISPIPADRGGAVSVELDSLKWSYYEDGTCVAPAGFRVYLDHSGEIIGDDFPTSRPEAEHRDDDNWELCLDMRNNDFVWVPYVEEQVEYGSSEILPEQLEYFTNYYWKVVTTTKEQGTGEGYDAEDVSVWSFRTERETSIDERMLPVATELKRNYPNPFNPDTIIEFSIREETNAKLSIYNAKGQLIKVLHDALIETGKHRVVWAGKDSKGGDAGSGVYFYRLQTEDYDEVSKMLLVK